MNKRALTYKQILRWTSLPLAVLIWLMLMTGPAVFKGELLRKLTFGVLSAAGSGKWHSVWLPVITAVVFYIHTAMGLATLAASTKWLKPKWLWEIIALAVGGLALAQFLWLYYG